jgi:hypothetical protein
VKSSLWPETEVLRSREPLLDNLCRISRHRGVASWIPGTSCPLGLINYVDNVTSVQEECRPSRSTVWFVQPILALILAFRSNLVDWVAVLSQFVLAHG